MDEGGIIATLKSFLIVFDDRLSKLESTVTNLSYKLDCHIEASKKKPNKSPGDENLHIKYDFATLMSIREEVREETECKNRLIESVESLRAKTTVSNAGATKNNACI